VLRGAQSCRKPAANDLEWKVDEDGDGQVLPSQALLDHFEGCNRVIGLEAYFGCEVDDEESLDICCQVFLATRMGGVYILRTLELANVPDGLVDGPRVKLSLVQHLRILEVRRLSIHM
jgi:hypothetical protein